MNAAFRHGLPRVFNCPRCVGMGFVDGGPGYGVVCATCEGYGRLTGAEIKALPPPDIEE